MGLIEGILFDTNAVIALLDKDPLMRPVLDFADGNNLDIKYSVISQTELLAGIGLEEELDIPFLQETPLSVDFEIATKAGRVRRQQKELIGRRLKTPDALILATAVVHNLALVTAVQDLQFGEEYGIRVINFRQRSNTNNMELF